MNLPCLYKSEQLPSGAHWITISHAAHPSSPLAGRHLLISSAGVIIGGAIPEEFYGKTLDQVHIIGAASTDHPFHVAAARVLGDVPEAHIDQLAQAFHAHPSASVSARLKTVATALEKAGHSQQAARRITSRIAAVLVKAKHLQARDVHDWQHNQQSTTALTIAPITAKAVRQAVISALLIGNYVPTTAAEFGDYPQKILDESQEELKSYVLNYAHNVDLSSVRDMILREMETAALRVGDLLSLHMIGAPEAKAWTRRLLDMGFTKHDQQRIATRIRNDTDAMNGVKKTAKALAKAGMTSFASAYAHDPVGKFPQAVAYAATLPEFGDRSALSGIVKTIAVLEKESPKPDASSYMDMPSFATSSFSALMATGFSKRPPNVNDRLLITAARLGLLPEKEKVDDVETIETSRLISRVAEWIYAHGHEASPSSFLSMLMNPEEVVSDAGIAAAFDALASGPSSLSRKNLRRFIDSFAKEEIENLLSSYDRLEKEVQTKPSATAWWQNMMMVRNTFTPGGKTTGEPRTVMKASPAEAEAVRAHILETVNKNHKIAFKILDVYKIAYHNPKFDELAQQYGNVRSLFHGTKNDAVAYCVSRGLRPPTNNSEISTGSMFGAGVYFADQSTKSLQYVDQIQSGTLLVCDVALGNELIMTKSDSSFNEEKMKQAVTTKTIVTNKRGMQALLSQDLNVLECLSYAANIVQNIAVQNTNDGSSLTSEQRSELARVKAAVAVVRQHATPSAVADAYADLDILRSKYNRPPRASSGVFATPENLYSKLEEHDVPGIESVLLKKTRQRLELLADILAGSATWHQEDTLLRDISDTASSYLSYFDQRGAVGNSAYHITTQPAQSIHAEPSDEALRNDEWVVFDPNQVQMRYAVKVQINTGNNK